jgi:hypothetical protein
MGFSRGFRPPKDVVEEYMNKLKSTYDEYIQSEITRISTTILIDSFNYPNNAISKDTNLETFMMTLRWNLERLEKMVKADTFLTHKETYDTYGYFHVAGWNFQNNEPQISKNCVYNICIKELSMWAATLITDFFKDEDSYFRKQEKIEETLDYFKDMMIEFTIFDFINYFKDYEDNTYDEDDDENENNVTQYTEDEKDLN